MMDFYWLPEVDDWTERLRRLADLSAEEAWPELVNLARARLDLGKTERLARAVGRLCGEAPPASGSARHVRLAILGSSTLDHLPPGVRVGGLRRNIWIDTYTGPYGQYAQELADPSSGVHAFKPTHVLFALDARHLVQAAAAEADFPGADQAIETTVARLRGLWRTARGLGAQVLQQTGMPVLPALLGANEQRLAWSPRRILARINEELARAADEDGVDLVRLDAAIEHGGLGGWYDPGQWHRAKQEVHPVAAPLYGDLVARVIGARLGCSSKCLVLDLDNTLWGGVIGDDGLEGIVLGQGSVTGEAHVALQAYAKDLARRGVVLAVCSKNDHANAIEPFERHPEMVLRSTDIACFVANWQDKASNLREIAARLNLGLDALTFVDDNPFERALVRRELPMVNVPELPDDAIGYVNCLSDAGYFETVSVTAEDGLRATQYQANLERERARDVTDLPAYLQSLEMELRWRRFDQLGLERVVQLINKSNQFNLTTRRYSSAEAAALIARADSASLQLRLVDRFGDNGMISVVIALPGETPATLEIDTWLMSCRVLGRQVEQEVCNLLAREAQAVGARSLRGVYKPTAKNGMVAEHYAKLGFEPDGAGEDGATFWRLDLANYRPFETFIQTIEEKL